MFIFMDIDELVLKNPVIASGHFVMGTKQAETVIDI